MCGANLTYYLELLVNPSGALAIIPRFLVEDHVAQSIYKFILLIVFFLFFSFFHGVVSLASTYKLHMPLASIAGFLFKPFVIFLQLGHGSPFT